MKESDLEEDFEMSMNDIISLNVGGTRFETTRQTLLHDPGSMLARMFDPVSPLQPGNVSFILVAGTVAIILVNVFQE